MTFHLTSCGFGIATEREPVRDNGKVLLTFKGEFADSVCVGGRFYPLVNGTAEVPTEDFGAAVPVTAYALGGRRRYVCDAIGRIGSGRDAFLTPITEDAEARLISLAIALGELSGRIDALEEDTRILSERIKGKPFTFGGTV